MMEQGNHEGLSAKQKSILLLWSKNFRDNAGDVFCYFFFFFMKEIDTVDEQTADLYACYLQAPSQFSSDEAHMLVNKL